ncbi:MAG: tetratricopeptide repeat protein [Planctomycetota bacterium]|nr:tetratricopeptide repeat protein [Planctomycetota bacterium]
MDTFEFNSLNLRLMHAYKTEYPTAELWIAELGYRLFPDDAWWATQYGAAAFNVGLDLYAERALLHAHPKRDKNRERVEWILGQVYQHQGRFDEAEKWYRMATATAPQKTGPWVYLGCFLANRERFREACEVLEQGLHAEGDVDEVYYNLGLNKRTLNDLEGAKKCFESALAITPDYTLAEFHVRDIDEALRIRREFAQFADQAALQ